MSISEEMKKYMWENYKEKITDLKRGKVYLTHTVTRYYSNYHHDNNELIWCNVDTDIWYANRMDKNYLGEGGSSHSSRITTIKSFKRHVRKSNLPSGTLCILDSMYVGMCAYMIKK